MKKIAIVAAISAASIIIFAAAGFAYYATDLFASAPSYAPINRVEIVNKTTGAFQLQFIRHATMLLYADGKKILVDPMLENAGSESPYPFTSNRLRNPLLSLPADKNDIIRNLDAVLLTHYHPDHFDRETEKTLPKDILILCQPGDEIKLAEKGFTNAKLLKQEFALGKISITPYRGNHALGKLRGPVGSSASYNIRCGGRSLFITGDALLDELLRKSLTDSRPDFIAAFTGSASFIFGAPITLCADELKQIAHILPETRIIAVHMNAINHCSLTKKSLAEFSVMNGFSDRLSIPSEGEILTIGM